VATEHERIMEMLEYLGNELTNSQAWPDKVNPITTIKNAYLKEYQEQKDQATLARYQKALSDGLPGLTKGIINAAQAFKGGDPFAGSAAIMDICSTLASAIGSIAPAGGPPGALIGALFSVLSMILNLFSPPAESLTSQLEKVIRNLTGEERMQEMESAQEAIRTFYKTVTNDGVDLDRVIGWMNPIEGSTFNSLRRVAQWLRNNANQKLPAWGTVFAAQCQAYVDLMRAVHLGLVNSSQVKKDGMGATVKTFLIACGHNHASQLTFLQDIEPAMQNRGTVWHIGDGGYKDDDGVLYCRDFVVSDAAWTKLQGYHRLFTVSATRGSMASANPTLAMFGLEVGEGPTLNPDKPFRKNGRTYSLCDTWPLNDAPAWRQVSANTIRDPHRDLKDCYDIWSAPGDADDEIFVYTANGGTTWGYKHTKEQDQAPGDRLKLEWINEDRDQPAGYNTGIVRVVRYPRGFAEKKSEIPWPITWVKYLGCEVAAGKSRLDGKDKASDHMEIYAKFSDKSKGALLPPWKNFTGIAVDSKYLWVFKADEIACMAHTNCRRAVDSKDTSPRWMTYKIPSPLPGMPQEWKSLLLDLSPCDDGTLLAVGSHIVKTFDISRGWLEVPILRGKIYTMVPVIDDEKNTLTIRPGTTKGPGGHPIETNGWTAVDVRASRVFKRPIYCWPLACGLREMLKENKQVALAREAALV